MDRQTYLNDKNFPLQLTFNNTTGKPYLHATMYACLHHLLLWGSLLPLDMPENLMEINLLILHVMLFLANKCL